MNLGRALSRAACHFKERCSLSCAGKTRTFTEIDENSNRFVNGLLKLGVKKTDRVAILSDNCVEYVEIDFALYKGGMIRVGINPMVSSREAEYMISDSGANTIIVSLGLLSLISSIMNKLPSVKNYICISEKPVPERIIKYQDFIEVQDVNYPKIQVDEDDIAMLFYTGGTTGIPKGAMHTHEGIINVVMNLQSEYLQLNRTDVLLSGGSLAHANGFRAILCFLEGAKFIIPVGFLPKEIFETVEREKVTVLCTVPTTLTRLSSYPDIKRYNLNSLRLITYGAAPMPTDTLKKVLKIFGNRLAQGYGQAEALMAITHLSQEDHILEGAEKDARKLASAGRPYSTVDVRIVDNRSEDVKPGEAGEVIVKGKITMRGYWNNPEATAEAIRDGWVYTGDIGTVDEDGYIYLIDRKKDMIISGGYNIYAREVEDVLHSHPAIAEAAVIGVPDDEWGESVKAVVTLKPGMTATEEEIIQFCKERLSSYKKPKSLDFVVELPKTSVGKISKKDLRAKYWEGQERAVH